MPEQGLLIVTGGAGFIGSNLVKALNARGRTDVLVADELGDGHKLLNLADCQVQDVLDRDEFLARFESGRAFEAPVQAIFHQGACANTREWNGRVVMEANYAYSRRLLDVCLARRIPLIYASSASVYGAGPLFREDPACESPLNPYAYSKLLFDQRVRRVLPAARSQVVGLRYFNVYGPREAHKGEMASVAYKLHRELEAGDRVRLFEGSAGYAPGEQRRDFVWVGDVVALCLWFLDHPERSGVFNAGTGRAQTFNDVARAVIAWHGRGAIEYVPFPAGLRDAYQSYTQADLSALRVAGFSAPFLSVEEGVPRYLDSLSGKR
jgi:ADP-L-glycero-D-manno-heptose 6-epimerase